MDLSKLDLEKSGIKYLTKNIGIGIFNTGANARTVLKEFLRLKDYSNGKVDVFKSYYVFIHTYDKSLGWSQYRDIYDPTRYVICDSIQEFFENHVDCVFKEEELVASATTPDGFFSNTKPERSTTVDISNLLKSGAKHGVDIPEGVFKMGHMHGTNKIQKYTATSGWPRTEYHFKPFIHKSNTQTEDNQMINKHKAETRNFLNGRYVDDMSDNDILEFIRAANADIETLKELDLDSKSVNKKVKEIKNAVKLATQWLDDRVEDEED